MSALEFNKIIAAMLTAGILASLSGFLAHLLVHPEMLEENAYVVAIPEDDGAAGAEEAPVADLATLLAAADMAVGEKGAKKCAACHSFDQGGANKVGPNLWNVVNRQIAGAPDFGYSDALKARSGESWTFENLNLFLESPKAFAPGTKMTFAGVKKPAARADLLSYLHSLSDSPAPLPQPSAAAAEETGEAAGEVAAAAVVEVVESASEAVQEAAAGAAETASEMAGFGAVVAAADILKGEKVAKKCKACHTLEAGAGNKIGPNLWGVVGRPVAAVEGFRYSSALAGLAGNAWTYEDLNAFILRPKDFAPGTKMTFAGIKKIEDRAALIAYLRTLSDAPLPLPE